MSDGEEVPVAPKSMLEFRVQTLERDVRDLSNKFNVIDGKMDKINDRIKMVMYIVVGVGLTFNVIGPDMAELLKSAFAG